jgi:hypothetical protein
VAALFPAARVTVLSALVSACAAPTLTQEGQLVFTETEQRGATVLTANGVEFIDRSTVPAPRIRKKRVRSPGSPRPAFCSPPDGILRATSRPVALEGNGLLVVMRASDRLLPTWGGELLMRLDVIVPPAAFACGKSTVREPSALAIVIDDDGLRLAAAVEAALDNLGQRDRVALVDSAATGARRCRWFRGRTAPGGRYGRTSARTAGSRSSPATAIWGKALDLAGSWLNKGGARTRRVLVLTTASALRPIVVASEMARGSSCTRRSK